MRPLELSLQGFQSYRAEQTIRFPDEGTLFALVGETGSGKSSILDAITFALYGTVARLDDARAVEPVISLGRQEATVTFRFRLGAEEYAVERQARRSGQPKAKLETADGTTLASQVRQVNEAVEALLGLDFKQFTRAVLLPQGDFAQLLHARGKDRQDLLKQLLGFERWDAIRAEAGDRARAAREEAQLLEARIGDLVSDETIAAAGAREKALRDLCTTLEAGEQERLKAEAAAREQSSRLDTVRRGLQVLGDVAVAPDASGLQAAADEASAAAQEADAALAQAQALLEERESARAALGERDPLAAALRDYERLGGLEQEGADLVPRATTAQEAADRAQQALAQAEAATRERREALAALPSQGEVSRLLQDHQALATARTQLPAVQESLARARQALTHAEGARNDARTALDQADAALALAQNEHGAAALVAGLKPGDACPVCAEPLAAIPVFPGEDAVQHAEDARRNAAATLQAAEAALNAAGREQDRQASAVEALQARIAELETALAGKPDVAALAGIEEQREALAGVLAAAEAAERSARDTDRAAQAGATGLTTEAGRIARDLDALRARLKGLPAASAITAQLRAIDDAQQALDAQRVVRDGADRTERAARRARDTANAALVAAVRTRDAQWDACAAAALGPDPALKALPLVEGWQALATWAARELDRLSGEERSLAAASRDVAATLAAIVDRQWAIYEETTGQERPGTGTPLGEAQKDLGAATSQLQALTAWRDRQRQDQVRLQELQVRARNLEQLTTQLGARYFERWLIDESLGDIVDVASEVLGDISRGAYALTLAGEGEIEVVDQNNAGEQRKVKTLSGGETFWASLALALALSETIARRSPRGSEALESLFIDEGFGTLDPESLDAVHAALEELSTRRLVGLVTHVQGLAERIPLRYRIAKESGSSRITVEDEGGLLPAGTGSR